MKRAIVVVDLGFGDAGKGLVTDYLVRTEGAGLVVRFNGGAQSGHNVVTEDGRHHTFSQFGSGSLRGARTVLTRHVLLDPDALVREAGVLEDAGVTEPLHRLRVSNAARVVTPYHRALGRLRELARGGTRHGSCGAGVGEAVRDSICYPAHTVTAADLLDPVGLRDRVEDVRARKWREACGLSPAPGTERLFASEMGIFGDDSISHRWIESHAAVRAAGITGEDRVLEEWLQSEECVLFEGAQGVLLDEDFGFHPHTTWSKTTSRNAIEVVEQLSPEAELEVVGVLRAVSCRHGPGPFPTEWRQGSLEISEHNRSGPWQGPMRYGWFDEVLARYAIACDGSVDRLALTFLDALPDHGWPAAVAYEIGGPLDTGLSGQCRCENGLLTAVEPPQLPASLSSQEALGRLLIEVKPRLDGSPSDPVSVVGRVERALDRPVELTGFGPTAGHVVRRLAARRTA